ncbi:MAG: hypothetical protein N3A66_10640 [Planctomycetota bacterium]|nr:hypothetical protein [Planctomycetota bacterium]
MKRTGIYLGGYLLVSMALAAMAGCERPPTASGITLVYKKPTAYYYEFQKDGTYYVFASNKKATAFRIKGEMPCMTAFINAGPDGKTFYVEADKGDNPEPARRLKRMFLERHPK